jgi:Putative DNA-binding domain
MHEHDDWQLIIDNIFRVDEHNPDRLITRESTTVEFKQSFHKKSAKWDEYCKTMASFANAKGGCLVFGVGDKPHNLLGMLNDHFEDFDPAELTVLLNARFSPEIHWSKKIYEIGSKCFGLIYVEESEFKPVIAISNGGNTFSEAEIHYRYRGRSEKIKYPELRQIIEDNRQREQELWMRHLRRIASIGVHNAAIFNPEDGTVTGKAGTFVIDQQLLPKLNFIREGEFRETEGTPAIKVVGEAQILAAGDSKGTESIERKAVRLNEILEFFLLQKTPSEPKFFIEQACYEQTGYLPIYYFSQIAKLDLNRLKSLIENEASHMQGQKKLIDRLNTGDTKLFQAIPNTSSKSATIKRNLRKDILAKTMSEPATDEDVRHRLESLQSLKKEDIDIEYIFPRVHAWYKQYWGKGGPLRSSLYKAICHLDKELFCPREFYFGNGIESSSGS